MPRFIRSLVAAVMYVSVCWSGTLCAEERQDVPRADEPKSKDQKSVVRETKQLGENTKSVRPGAKPEPKVDDSKRFQPFGYIAHEHEVTISGQALNEEGEPVAGARVFVVYVIPMGVAYGNLPMRAEVKTDAEGRYRFDKVKLSVLEFAPQAVPRPSEALFQVFAFADGYGYVWRRTHTYRPEKRPDDAAAPVKPGDAGKSDSKPGADQPPGDPALRHVFFAGEPIVLDLEFSPEVRLHGTVSDDLGNPLKNAVVQVGLVNSSRDSPGTPPGVWSGHYLEETRRGVDGAFNGLNSLPEEFRLARTDGDGHYEIRGVPRDCSLLAYLDYLPEYDPWGDSLHTGKAAPQRGRFVGYGGELNHVFIAPVTVRVRTVGRNRQPLANVIVRYEANRGVRREGALDRTDAGGTATLKLHPGKCMVIVEPTIGQPYLPQKLSLELKDDPREQSIDVELDSAAEVVFEAVEKGTGKPVAGVSFLSEPADARERQPVESQLSFVDHPRTDEQGRMQAFFNPGARQFFVDQKRSPYEFEPLAPTTEIMDVSPEKRVHLRFEFTRRPAAEPRGDEPEYEPIADDLKPLAELLQKQRERFERLRYLRFHLRHNNFLQAPLTYKQISQLLDSFESKTVEECLESIRGTFPDFTGLGTYIITTDGIRRRVEVRYSGQNWTETHTYNGEETFVNMGAGTQLDIYDRDNARIHFLAPHDFWNGPARPYRLTTPKPPAGEKAPRRTVRHADGAWEIEIAGNVQTDRWIIEDATGFERLNSYSYGDHQSGQETRQYFPTLLTSGIAVPKLSVRVYYHDAKLSRCEVTFIDNVELLEGLPADAFIVAAAAGTNILDYRGIPVNELGGGRQARSGVVSAPVPDVLAYRNRFAPAGAPVLKVGDECPALNVLTWLDAEGKADRPALGGKIIVVDFWGINCGPCVAQLPEVNAAAKHFAGSKIIVVGLHDSSGTLEGVAEFAKKRGLVFPIAIDTPDKAARSFGTTFASFGISAIPTCAVIDGTGRVAYLGQFDQAIEVANRLAEGK